MSSDPGRFEALLSHQGPLVHVDHFNRAPVRTANDCAWWDSACKERQEKAKQEEERVAQGLQLLEKTGTIDMEKEILANGKKVMGSGGIGVGQWFIQVTVESIGAFMIMQKHVITFLYDKPPDARPTSLRIYDGNQVWLDVDASRNVTLIYGVELPRGKSLKRWEKLVLAKAMHAFNEVVNGRKPNTLTALGR